VRPQLGAGCAWHAGSGAPGVSAARCAGCTESRVRCSLQALRQGVRWCGVRQLMASRRSWCCSVRSCRKHTLQQLVLQAAASGKASTECYRQWVVRSKLSQPCSSPGAEEIQLLQDELAGLRQSCPAPQPHTQHCLKVRSCAFTMPKTVILHS